MLRKLKELTDYFRFPEQQSPEWRSRAGLDRPNLPPFEDSVARSSFASLIKTKATRGRHQTINIE